MLYICLKIIPLRDERPRALGSTEWILGAKCPALSGAPGMGGAGDSTRQETHLTWNFGSGRGALFQLCCCEVGRGIWDV